MAVESPLFQSSMELLGHSIEHFVAQGELDRKLVILHLANAVELLLKDVMLDGGASIYKGNGSVTVSIHDAIEAVTKLGVTIPCHNKLQLLIDERNALQHRYGSPNELTTIYYMEAAMEFFEKMLKDTYNRQLDETLQQFTTEGALASFTQRKPVNKTELEKLVDLASLHPLGALLSANAYLETMLRDFLKRGSWPSESVRHQYMVMPLNYRIAERFGIQIPDDLKAMLERFRQTRNSAAHGSQEISVDDVSNAVKAIEGLETILKDKAPGQNDLSAEAI